MNIKKPNSFARHGNDYVAPLTTIDQIVKPSGERYTDREFELMSNVENVMFGDKGAGKNLLKPTLQTQTANGITCTNNGDGTYTLNGTATDQIIFWFNDLNIPTDGKRIVAFPPSNTEDIGYSQVMYSDDVWGESEIGSGKNLASGKIIKSFIFTVRRGATVNNLLLKPMITSDLTATYNDFEPYVKSLKQLTDSALNMDLLWTNASPTSAFASQTISLDLSKYNLVFIDFVEKSGSSFYCCALLNKGITKAVGYICSYNLKTMIRQIKITDSYLEFKDAYITSTSSDNNYLIPYKIYGVK